MSLSLEKCTSHEKWDAFVRQSQHEAVFCLSAFLKTLGAPFELYFVTNGSQPRMGAILFRDAQGNVCPPPIHIALYQGILFHRDLYEKAAIHTSISDRLKLVEFFLDEIEKQTNKLSFCLHPHFDDIRGLLWFHYHQPELGQFKLQFFYTGCIDLKLHSTFEAYLSTIRKSRRADHLKAQKAGLTVRLATAPEEDLETLIRLYKMTFERQDIAVDPKKITIIEAIARASISGGWGDLLIAETPAKEATSAILTLRDSRTAYYLFAANHPDFRSTGSGTFLLLESIRLAASQGMECFDMCGINSPTRGDFKTSLNAAPVPYYFLNWNLG